VNVAWRVESEVVAKGNRSIDRNEEDEFSRYCLLNGLDDIELTLQHEPLIREFESAQLLTPQS
jgi:3-isopropylmalate dehydratase small subunit